MRCGVRGWFARFLLAGVFGCVVSFVEGQQWTVTRLILIPRPLPRPASRWSPGLLRDGAGGWGRGTLGPGYDLPNMGHGEARVTATKGLRLRVDPSLSGKVLELLPCDAVVTVWQTDGPWWWVQAASGATGWAHSEYLRVCGELVRGA